MSESMKYSREPRAKRVCSSAHNLRESACHAQHEDVLILPEIEATYGTATVTGVPSESLIRVTEFQVALRTICTPH
eukprot:2520830-Rhodomonas_salina.1